MTSKPEEVKGAEAAEESGSNRADQGSEAGSDKDDTPVNKEPTKEVTYLMVWFRTLIASMLPIYTCISQFL